MKIYSMVKSILSLISLFLLKFSSKYFCVNRKIIVSGLFFIFFFSLNFNSHAQDTDSETKKNSAKRIHITFEQTPGTNQMVLKTATEDETVHPDLYHDLISLNEIVKNKPDYNSELSKLEKELEKIDPEFPFRKLSENFSKDTFYFWYKPENPNNSTIEKGVKNLINELKK